MARNTPAFWDGGLDLGPVADDPGVAISTSTFSGPYPATTAWDKAVKGGMKRLPFFQNGEPGEARLEPFQGQHLKEFSVIMLRTAPLSVVVSKIDL